MFNSVGVICKPNDFTSQKTALELGVLLKDLGVNFLQDQEKFESEADLIIVAGRPSMGKTALMMNMAESAVIAGDKPVLVFSLEMPSHSLILRMLSSLGRIDQTKIRTGQLGDDDWPRLTSAVTLLNDKPLFVDDTPALTPNEIRSRSRRIAREHGALGMIVGSIFAPPDRRYQRNSAASGVEF